MIGYGAGNALIEPSRVNGGLKLNVARLQIMLVKPNIELVSLLGRQRVNGVLDLLVLRLSP